MVDESQSERPVGEEARKSQARRRESGFTQRYLSGANILDIGYRGYIEDVVPIVPQAIGVELDYPGYDGRTLPFPEHSQDAVFASHCLEHIEDFRQSVRDWFRVLRVGGFLVIMVPHQYLYEKRLALPSHYNADHKRFYTPGSLMLDIEETLEPNSYRLRHLADNDMHFDYAIPPEKHSGGCYEIELVIERIAPPDWTLRSRADDQAARPPGVSPPAEVTTWSPINLQQEAAKPGSTRLRILVLKLDHFGDLIIATPALRRLRAAFPAAHITVVCAPWNAGNIGPDIADTVLAFQYFTSEAAGWHGQPVNEDEKFREVVHGRFDIAIDLRVDGDTRQLLRLVDAGLLCGIGSRQSHPWLDVILPWEHDDRGINNPAPQQMLLEPQRFRSGMHAVSPFTHELRSVPAYGWVIEGPNLRFPPARITAKFGLSAAGPLALFGASVVIEVVRNADHLVARKELKRRRQFDLDEAAVLEFDNDDGTDFYDFRVYVAGRMLGGRLSFHGVALTVEQQPASFVPLPRVRGMELHVGEQLALLVQLVHDHVTTPYPSLPETEPASRPLIVLAPVSNSAVRDWPTAAYSRLVGLLLDRLDCDIVLTGTRLQMEQLNRILRANPTAGSRLRNLAGRTAWSELAALLDRAALVICNNSGIAHLAAARGRHTLAIYSASHPPQEWGPRGRHVQVLVSELACSPCGFERLADCHHNHACMTAITPERVADEAVAFLTQPA